MKTISQTTVKKLNPAEKDFYLWDNDLKGYGVKVTPAGSRVYLVQYRAGGRTRRVTIGKHGNLTEDEARKLAKQLLGQVASGIDPAKERDEKKADVSMGALLLEFRDSHIRPKLKTRTAEEYERIIKNHIPVTLSRKPIREVERAQISKLHHEKRDIPFQANHILAMLSKFFNWCEKNGYRADGSNPCRHIEKFKTEGRERFLSEVELARLGEALEISEREKSASIFAISAIRMLMLTGARLSEILTLKWDWVNYETQTLNLPDSKTGKKTIYLNPPALAVLSALPKLHDNPFVICGEKDGAHLVNLQKPWRRVRSQAGLDDVRIHDLRHTFASVAVAGGMSLPLIGKLLGHSQPGTTARYAHLSADPIRQASSAIGTKIHKHTNQPTKNNVNAS
jgi:integrase